MTSPQKQISVRNRNRTEPHEPNRTEPNYSEPEGTVCLQEPNRTEPIKYRNRTEPWNNIKNRNRTEPNRWIITISHEPNRTEPLNIIKTKEPNQTEPGFVRIHMNRTEPNRLNVATPTATTNVNILKSRNRKKPVNTKFKTAWNRKLFYILNKQPATIVWFNFMGRRRRRRHTLHHTIQEQKRAQRSKQLSK